MANIPDASPQEPTKRCPYCAEVILAAARKCKHCGEFLDADANAAPPRTMKRPERPNPAPVPPPIPASVAFADSKPPRPRRWSWSWKWGCLGLAGLPVLLLGAWIVLSSRWVANLIHPERLPERTLKLEDAVRSIAFNDDGTVLAAGLNRYQGGGGFLSGPASCSFGAWRLSDPMPTPLFQEDATISAGGEKVMQVDRIAYSKAGRSWGVTYRAAGAFEGMFGNVDRSVALHDAASGDLIRRVTIGDKNVGDFRFAPDGNSYIAYASGRTAGQPFLRFDTATGRRLGEIETPANRYCYSPVYSPDGKRLAWTAGEADGPPSGFSLSPSVRIKSLVVANSQNPGEFREYACEVYEFQWSPDGDRILIMEPRGQVQVINARTLNREWTLDRPARLRNEVGKVTALIEHGTKSRNLFWGPDPHWIFEVVDEGNPKGLYLWNTETRQVGHCPYVDVETLLPSIAFSPDGSRVAVASNFRGIDIWKFSDLVKQMRK